MFDLHLKYADNKNKLKHTTAILVLKKRESKFFMHPADLSQASTYDVTPDLAQRKLMS